MSDSNFARSWLSKKRNAKNVVAEPSGIPYGELEDKWVLIRDLLKSR